MLPIFVLAIIFVLTAILFVAAAARSEQEERGLNKSLAVLEAMANAPGELTQEVAPSFQERVLNPSMDRLVGFGKRITGRDSAERFRRKLELAGNPAGWTVDRVFGGKVVGLIAGFAVGLIFAAMVQSFVTKLLIVAGVTVAGYFAPNLWLYQRAYDRMQTMRKALPDAIDLLTISVEAGLAFDAAIQQVARNTEGPLAEEFARMLREMQLGQGRSEALRGLADRTDLDELKGFVSAMVQADQFGIPIGQVLRVQASEMRTKRRQRAEEKAQQVPVKMTIPLIFCILPCLFIAVMGPAAISIINTFSQR